MRCVNKECPCGLYDYRDSDHCRHLWPKDDLAQCPSYKPEEKKKRELIVTELLQKGARFIHQDGWVSPINFNVIENMLTWGACSAVCTIKMCCEKGLKWSTDGLNKQSFEVEE